MGNMSYSLLAMLTVSENHNFEFAIQVTDGHNAYRGQITGDLPFGLSKALVERKNIETQPGLKPVDLLNASQMHGVLILEQRIDSII